MIERLKELLPVGWDVARLAEWGVIAFVSTTLLSVGVIALVVTRLPTDFFIGPETPSLWPGLPWPIRLLLRIGKNLVGLVIVLLGLVMSLPGVPGQGLLTVLIGLMAIDYPGKRRFEQWLFRRRGVAAGLNRIRGWFGQPPLQTFEDQGSAVAGSIPTERA